ncbi:hypothetical protein DYGSA30_13370 [Dyella sp. GSA-30]|nr:hypothetical protein DYGSA30_13370 [Dyella sp. GSA-30]
MWLAVDIHQREIGAYVAHCRHLHTVRDVRLPAGMLQPAADAGRDNGQDKDEGVASA